MTPCLHVHTGLWYSVALFSYFNTSVLQDSVPSCAIFLVTSTNQCGKAHKHSVISPHSAQPRGRENSNTDATKKDVKEEERPTSPRALHTHMRAHVLPSRAATRGTPPQFTLLRQVDNTLLCMTWWQLVLTTFPVPPIQSGDNKFLPCYLQVLRINELSKNYKQFLITEW